MAEVKLDLGKLVPSAMLVITVILGLGVWQTAQALQVRVADLELQVEKLEGFEDQLSDVAALVAGVQADVADVARSRDEILEAICRILERPPATCGLSQQPAA